VLFALLLALGLLTAIAAPSPITFPRDDGAHDEPIEWWYYTGHLFTESGDRYGFEFVVFKARLGRIAASASHFAITDNARGTFQFDQRFEPESANAPNDSDIGFSYEIGGWSIDVAGGDDAISASMDGYGLDLAFSSRKPPALHGGDGFIDYGDDQGSYYYSRTPPEHSQSMANRWRSPERPGSITNGAPSRPSSTAAGTGTRCNSTIRPN
jgi:predicted secreted hydrolase